MAAGFASARTLLLPNKPPAPQPGVTPPPSAPATRARTLSTVALDGSFPQPVVMLPYCCNEAYAASAQFRGHDSSPAQIFYSCHLVGAAVFLVFAIVHFSFLVSYFAAGLVVYGIDVAYRWFQSSYQVDICLRSTAHGGLINVVVPLAVRSAASAFVTCTCIFHALHASSLGTRAGHVRLPLGAVSVADDRADWCEVPDWMLRTGNAGVVCIPRMRVMQPAPLCTTARCAGGPRLPRWLPRVAGGA